MVFQQPNPFPFSIYDNVAFGLKLAGEKNREYLDQVVETSLKQAAVWDEVKDHLHESALSLSGGQQQRVFLARSLAQKAECFFLDEPFVGIDVASEEVIINILKGLRDEGKTVFVVHHDLSKVENYFDELILVNKKLIGVGPVNYVFQPDLMQEAYQMPLALLASLGGGV